MQLSMLKTNTNEAGPFSQDPLTVADRLIAVWEITSVTLSFLIAAWIVRPLGGGSDLIAAIPLSMAFVLMLVSHRARKETRYDVGWRLDNFSTALRLLILPMLGGAMLIVTIGLYSGGFRSNKWLDWRWLLWLLVWGLIQQYSLQGFINRRAQLVFGRGYKSVLLVATVFAVLHLPNPFLTFATFLGGVLWAVVYQRTPNLLALSVSHALISLLLVFALPNSVLNGLRVGFRFFA